MYADLKKSKVHLLWGTTVLTAKKFSSKILKWLSIAFSLWFWLFIPLFWALNFHFGFIDICRGQCQCSNCWAWKVDNEISNLTLLRLPSERAEEEKDVIDFFAMAMGALAGLVLFIYGVTRLSEGLEEMGTERMKGYLASAPLTALGSVDGSCRNNLLESSSVTIIMVMRWWVLESWHLCSP